MSEKRKEAIISSISEVTIDQIQDFLASKFIPRVCQLCHGEMMVLPAYKSPEEGDGSVEAVEDKPSIAHLVMHGRPDQHSEFRMPCYTLACIRCGAFNRLSFGPLLEQLGADPDQPTEDAAGEQASEQ